jgi:two-component system OmpR family response regulator
MRILVVEDDKKIASFIAKGLKQAGWMVDTAADGQKGLDLAVSETYDAAIMDLMLPKRDGFSIIQEMRAQNIKTPIIILSAKRSVDDRVKGLQAGGDDYLTKPFSFSELLARIHALVRRVNRTHDSTHLHIADLSMDLVKREVERGGKLIELHSREWSLLELFLRHPGRMISKTMILENVWDYDFDPQTNVVDVLVFRLRNKIDKGFSKKLLHTTRGMGYVLKNA